MNSHFDLFRREGKKDTPKIKSLICSNLCLTELKLNLIKLLKGVSKTQVIKKKTDNLSLKQSAGENV